MKNFDFKIYFISAIFFVLSGYAYAQDKVADQSLTPNPQPHAPKVVEIETDIEADQIKASEHIDKPTIKPRKDYLPGKTKMKNKNSANDHPPATSDQQSASSDQRPTADDQPQPPNPQPQISDTKNSDEFSKTPPNEVITDDQVVQISTSLRRLIEDNNKLKEQIANLDVQLKTVRGQQKLDANHLNEVAMERDALKKQNQNIVSLGSQSDEKLKALQKELAEKEENYNRQIVMLQTQLAQKLQTAVAQSPASTDQPPTSNNPQLTPNPQPLTPNSKKFVTVNVVSAPTAEEAKKRGESVLLALNKVSEEKQKLLHDEARVHYNMGNNYYNQGDYLNAAAEYKKTLELTPEDASAHYNLAFVSGEYLNNPKTALIHYKRYLFYNPHAEDAVMVQQKIIEAETLVKGDVKFNSKIEDEIRRKKNEVNEMLSK